MVSALMPQVLMRTSFGRFVRETACRLDRSLAPVESPVRRPGRSSPSTTFGGRRVEQEEAFSQLSQERRCTNSSRYVTSIVAAAGSVIAEAGPRGVTSDHARATPRDLARRWLTMHPRFYMHHTQRIRAGSTGSSAGLPTSPRIFCADLTIRSVHALEKGIRKLGRRMERNP